jgi:hypothetical protein
VLLAKRLCDMIISERSAVPGFWLTDGPTQCRDLKRVHRDRAARLQAADDPLLVSLFRENILFIFVCSQKLQGRAR